MGTRLFTMVAALSCCGLAWGQPDAGGCTDIAACNYDSSATNDDGTCTFPGCTDSSACNYDATAGCDDSSCVLPDTTGACDCFLDCAADLSIECGDSVDPENTGSPIVSGGCEGEADLSYVDEVSGDDCEQIITRTWSLFFEDQPIAECVQIITVVDTTAPVVEGEAFLEMPCDMIADEILVTATDNCDEDVEITFTDDNVSGGCVGNVIRIYTATDDCGNSTEFTQVINLFDEVAPEFSAFPVDVTAECDDVPGVSDMVDAEDNCSEASIEYNGEEFIAGDCLGNYTLVRTWTATDNCGNANVQSQTIHVSDTTAPTWVEGTLPADVTVECSDELSAVGMPEAEDNCDDEVEIEVTEEITPGDCPNNYMIQRIYRGFDNCGNQVLYVQEILVQDTTAPELEIAEGVTLECDQEIPAAAWEASDNCSEELIEEVTEVIIDGDCPNNYTIERTYSVTDECGNNTSATQIITVQDTTAPVFDDYAETLTIDCGDLDSVEPLTATDNCDEEVTIEVETVDGSGGCPGTIIYEYTATDDCGNSTSATQYVTLTDTIAPVINNPEDMMIECDEVGDLPDPNAIEITDNCDEEATVTFEEIITEGFCEDQYTITWTWTAEDDCENITTATTTITVSDTTAPTWVEGTLPADVTVECSDELSAVGMPEAEDNCDDEVEIEVTEEITPGDCPNNYMIQRIYRGFDNCGNQVLYVQEIIVQDTTAPELEIAEGVTLECDQEIPAAAWEASDNCSEELIEEVTEVIVDGDCPNNYTIERTYSVTDECGNNTSATQIITVQDTTAPEFTFVSEGGEYSCNAEIPAFQAEAEDACSEVTVTSSEEVIAGDCPQSYSVIITWTATDACGNAAEAQTTYAVYDNEAPVILDEFSDLVFECVDDVPDFTECNAVDNCDEDVDVTVSMEVINEDECGNYDAVVTCTAVDDCGNASSTTFVVTVLDETAPEFVEAPDDLVLDCEDEVPAPADLTAVDNCGGEVSISYTEEQFGDVPNPDAVQDCNLISPISPFYNPDWALWLEGFPGGDYYTLLNGEFLLWEDNSATITGSVVSVDNPQAGFDFVVQLDNGLDWEGWSTQDFPTGYKDDFNAAGDNYLDWMYFIIDGDLSSLSGWGDLNGVELTIAHAPAGFYFGYQLGIAANNVNSNYGSGGWIYYEGTVDGEPVEGAGDFAFDHDCCPDYSIVRTWCAVDCSGNETCVEQIITSEDLGEDEELVSAPGSDLTDTTGDIDIMAIAPNPTTTNTTVKIGSKRNQTITLEVYDLGGRKVATLFNQRAEADVAYILNFGADVLESGVYTLRLSSHTEQVVEKLIVGK